MTSIKTSVNGRNINLSNNTLIIDGIEIDLNNYEQKNKSTSDNKKPSKEFFEPGEHYLNGFSFILDKDGKLTDIISNDLEKIVINGNVTNFVKSGSGDTEINGNITNLVKSGSGDIFKR